MSATAAESLRPGSTSRWPCYDESGRETTWRWGGTQNHSMPATVTWICTTRVCGRVRTALADMGDADGFVRTYLDRHLRRISLRGEASSADVSFDELYQDAWMRLMQLYNEWDPRRGLTFTSYATHLLPLRLHVFTRERLGKGGGRRGADDVYFDALRGGLESVVGTGQGDPVADRDPTLLGVLLRGDRPRAGVQRALGRRPAPRPTRRD